MSELQLALLIIGIGMIVVLYTYGWWQQRQYRRRFGEAFNSGREDVLYQEINSISGEEFPDTARKKDAAATLLNESCSLLNNRVDFIVDLHLNEASPAAVLDGLWQRKFDFGKPVYVCGQPLGSDQWERAIPESPVLYEHFRIALQLVDRSGAINPAKLAEFRDLVDSIAKQIKAEATIPDVDETHHRAVQLDAFCAAVDQMVGVNLLPPGTRLLIGSKIAQSAALLGMSLESDGAFHLLDVHGHSLFSLGNIDSEPFRHHQLETSGTAGITLLLDVPRVENPTHQFDKMMQVANGLAKNLQVNLVDDLRMPLNENGLAVIRGRITEVEAQMAEQGFPPGSLQARRLFS